MWFVVTVFGAGQWWRAVLARGGKTMRKAHLNRDAAVWRWASAMGGGGWLALSAAEVRERLVRDLHRVIG